MDAIFVIFPPVLGIAVVSAELARSKGYKGRWWFLISLFIPLLSLFILFLLPNKRKSQPLVVVQQPTHNDKILYQKNA